MKRMFSRILSGCEFLLLLFGAAQAALGCGQNVVITNLNLPNLSEYTFQVSGLNATGQITGFHFIAGQQGPRAFLWNNNSGVQDLGTLGGTLSQGNAINSSGQVAGQADLSADFIAHAALFTGGNVVDIQTLGGNNSSASALNDIGQVVGGSDMPGSTWTQGFLYYQGKLTPLGTLGSNYSTAFAINNSGLVVGESGKANGDVHGFKYLNGTISDLNTLGGGYSSAFAVNNSNIIVGESLTGSGDNHGFVYANGVMTDVGTVGGTYSTAFAVNDSGQVIGIATDAGENDHGFIYTGGNIVDLGTLDAEVGADYAHALAINNSGWVVGESAIDTNGDLHAFVWKQGQMTDLNTLLPANSGYVLTSAQFVNDAGRIVGLGTLNGVSIWFVLDAQASTDTPPVANAGPNQTIDCQAEAVLNGSASTASGGSSLTYQWTLAGTVLGTNAIITTALPIGTNVVTLKVTDNCGMSAQANVTVTVTDTTAPTISGGGSLTASSDTNCQATVPNLVTGLTISDNCTPLSALVISQNPAPGTLLGLGQHFILVKATDTSGNSSTAGFSFTVVDSTPPTIISGPALSPVVVDSNCQAPVPSVTGSIVASDNCTPAGSLVITQNPVAGTLVGPGPQTIVVTVTDAAGNSTSGTLSFSAVDTNPPTIVSISAPATVSVGANCQGIVPDLTAGVVAFDNCTPSNQLVLAQSPGAGTSLPVGSHTVTVSVTDASGNVATTNVSLTVADLTAPSIVSVPAPFTLNVGDNCQAAVPNVLAGVSATDNCTPVNTLVLSQSPTAGTPVGIGPQTVIVKVADASGNVATTNISFNVVDSTAPVIVSVQAPLTVNVGNNCQAAVPNVLAGVSATDNCTPVNSLVLSQAPTAGTPVGAGQHTVVVTVADASGNIATTNVSFNVVDSTPPIIVSAPVSFTVSVGNNCQAAVPNVLANVVATDNCTPVNALVLSQSPTAGTLVGAGQQTIVVTVADAFGNVATTNISVTVVDSTPPTIVSAPAPFTVSPSGNCQGIMPNVLGGVVATDNCTPASALVLSQSPAAGATLSAGQYTLTVTVADASGNMATTNIAFTVLGGSGSGPVIQSITANPNILSPPNHQLVPVTVSVVAADNCDPSAVSKITCVTANEPFQPSDVQITGNLTVNLAATRNPSGDGRLYTITVQCIDASGNSATGTVTVAVPKGNNIPTTGSGNDRTGHDGKGDDDHDKDKGGKGKDKKLQIAKHDSGKNL